MRRILIENRTHPSSSPISAAYCASFWSRFRGLMFHPGLDDRAGILLVEGGESRVNTSIHMLFMRFDIAAVWIDSNMTVVDARLAHRWRLSYVPSKSARYTLETRPEYLSEFHIGDTLVFHE